MMFGHQSRRLSLYAEGLLSAPEAARVAGHLLACRRCRRELELVREGVRFGALLGRAAPSEDSLPAWSDLAPRLVATPPPRMTVSFGWAPALAALVLVVAGGAALWWPRTAGPSPLESAALAAHGAPVAVKADDEPSLARLVTGQGLRATWPAAVVGGALVGASPLPGGGAALSFSYQGQPVTLAVARADAPAPASKRIAYRTVGELEVARWLSGDQSYVLVSRLRGDASCAICHGARI
jgi:anti-sigma factor RsiW